MSSHKRLSRQNKSRRTTSCTHRRLLLEHLEDRRLLSATGTEYPAYGGNTFAASGANLGEAGGYTFHFGGFSGNQAMYWGPTNAYWPGADVCVSMDGPGTPEAFNESNFQAGLSNFAGGIAIWQRNDVGSIGTRGFWRSIPGNGASDDDGHQPVDDPLSLTNTVGSTPAGLGNDIGVVRSFTAAGGGFKANMIMEALDGSTGSP